MAIGAGIGALLGGILGGVGTGYAGYQQRRASEEAAQRQLEMSKYATDIQKQLAERRMGQEQALTGYQLERQQQLADAYRQAYQKALGQFGTGEEKLEELYGQTPEALETLREQALTGQARELQQGTRQLQAALAQQGLRGGQAATQLRRGIGEMTETASENIQDIIAREALQREAQRRGYLGAQQQALQQFLISPQTAQYSQPLTTQQKMRLQEQLGMYQAV